MNLAELFARAEHRLRPFLIRFPSLYYKGREHFTNFMISQKSPEIMSPPKDLILPRELFEPHRSKKIWGLDFNLPIFNAAGMFKNGQGYEFCARQNAGAYLAGTTTMISREGNERLPFLPFPRSKAAINKLGLPNPGHEVVANRLSKIERVEGCPVGASIHVEDDIQHVLEGLWIYEAAGVDFVELNISCPNVSTTHTYMCREVELLAVSVAKKFRTKINRRLPIVLKLSNDVSLRELGFIINILRNNGFDGVNLGNTSTRYGDHIYMIAPEERKHYTEFLDREDGGGVSGLPLRERSLELVRYASEVVGGDEDFHIIRTGGIETARDVFESLEAGASLCQWYTGYFHNYAIHGERLYETLAAELLQLLTS